MFNFQRKPLRVMKPESSEKDLKRDLPDGDNSDDESPGAALLGAKQARMMASRQCPYLDTIDRGLLDFDFEKLLVQVLPQM